MATKTDDECVCSCHNGQYLFHVRWKPCCEEPIDGGVKKRVFERLVNGEVYPVIAETQEEADQLLKEIFDIEVNHDTGQA